MKNVILVILAAFMLIVNCSCNEDVISPDYAELYISLSDNNPKDYKPEISRDPDSLRLFITCYNGYKEVIVDTIFSKVKFPVKLYKEGEYEIVVKNMSKTERKRFHIYNNPNLPEVTGTIGDGIYSYEYLVPVFGKRYTVDIFLGIQTFNEYNTGIL